jgi:predicted transposase YbfD/YdcC
MVAVSTVSLHDCFGDLHDCRREHLRLHNLWDIIALTICAVVCGADNWVEIERYGHRKRDWLERLLELANGIPSHNTLGRVFALIDPGAFQRCFGAWAQALVQATEGRLIAIDGKTLRGSADPANGRGALHLISAWAQANHLVLGQLAVPDKSNEITAIPELLQLIDVTGAVVTIDAMGCQKEIADKIVVGGGDYVLALKDNHPTLADEVSELFCAGLDNDFADLPHRGHTTQEKGHGRVEARHYHQVKVPQELLARHPGWKNLRTLGMVFSERQVGAAEPTGETRFYLSSLPLGIERFAAAVRGHWGIENNLHWVLDVCFDEDANRSRTDHGPANLALMRRIAACLLKQETTAKGGTKCKRKQAGWDNQYLLKVLDDQLD